MKVLAYILTAAAVLIGADVFVLSDSVAAPAAASVNEAPMSLHGGNGIPPPPPD